MTISSSFTGFSQVLQQDYDALVAFYAATNGDGWTTKTGWLGPNDATVGTWFGVVVESGRVVQISLPNNNLSGTLPAQLANLSALRFLILGPDQPPFTNQIGGTIPVGIGNLTNLIRLNLQFNAFTGTIPSELSNLPALVRLELSANQLSGTIPAALGNLSTLQFLALGSNSLTGAIPSELGQLTALTSISLAANQLSGSIPVSLGNLSQLISLQLQLNQLSGSLPIELSNLTALRSFYFNNNQLTGGVPSWLGDMTTLEIVQGDNNALAGTLPATLGNLSNLTTLTFTNCQLTGTVPASLTNLGALTFLRLNTNFFTSLPDLSTIGGLSGTSNFQIQNNNLTFESIEPVVAKNPTYSPQRQIPGIADFNVDEGNPITLTYTVGGSANSYQWYKNNVAIPGATNTTFTVPSAALSDAGSYYLEILNSIATALTLRTESTVVSVNNISSPNWIKIDIGSTNGLLDVDFPDQRAGFTAGDNGAFFRTTNGGEAWEDLTAALGDTRRIFDVHFIDRHRGWLVGNSGLVARTENGGLNWETSTFGGGNSTVWFVDEKNGWLGYSNGNVFKTSDGGITWLRQTTGTSAIIDEIQFLDSQNGYIACASSGSGGRLLKTTNAGETWQVLNPSAVNSLQALHFFNTEKGFFGGLNGFLYSTSNGGESYSDEGRPSNSTIHSINFASDNIGWFSGLNNTLYSTTNGGASWERETIDLAITDQIRAVRSLRTDFAWASVFPSGFLLKYGQIGNVIVDGYESLVQKTFNATGEQDFNEAGNFTGTAVRISALSGSSTVAVRLQQEAPVNRQLALLPTPQFANMRWLVTATGTLPQGYEIVFDLDNIPGLPIHTDKNMFRVARRNTEGTGSFELAISRFEGNKLIAAGTANHEFTLVLVSGPTVTDVSVCSGDNAVLTASGAQAGQTYRWYQNSNDVTPVFTGNPFVVTSVVADATYYVSLTDGVLESIRVPVLVEVRTCDNLFIVNSALDTPDANVGDGICDDGNGNCTLRAAIQEVNTLTAPAVIHFNIPGTGPHRIQPTTVLPAIQQKVELDARTQPGYSFNTPMVVLSGINAGNVSGITFSGSSAESVLRGMVIGGYQQNGILLSANAIILQGNYIGIDADGITALPNAQNGIFFNPSSNSLVGGPQANDRNILSGNGNRGIWLFSGTNNVIAGNFIGTSAAGAQAVPNRNGIIVQAPGNIIGGDAPQFTNVISGNGVADTFLDAGIQVESANNIVRGNIIGLNAAGTAAIPNEDGLRVGNLNNIIGGPNSADRNVISGNSRIGISSIGAILQNLIIEGNYIGTDITGSAAVGNTNSGILLFNATNSTIKNNLVSGNQSGIDLQNTTQVTVIGNKVGTNHTGLTAIPNNTGIRLQTANTINNHIGGTLPEEVNLVAGNSGIGIYIFGGASQNSLSGNIIGVNAAANPLPNSTGIFIAHGFDNIIGGDQSGAANIIAHNAIGIRLNPVLGSDPDPKRNRIMRNSIYSNTGLGIALRLTSVQVNDPDDSDDGPNQLQNYPLIYTYSFNSTSNEVTVTYAVSSNPVTGRSTYPIDVEFFVDDGNRQGRAYLHTDSYTAANFTNGKLKTITFSIPASVAFTGADKIVATATDAQGNTSEFGFIAPTPATASGIDQCLPSSVTLVASGAPSGGGYRWYAGEDETTPVSTNQTFITPVLTTTTTYYLAARDIFGNESLRAPVTVVIGSAPDKPVVTGASSCTSSSLVLTATGAALGYEYVWYENLTDTNPIVKNSTGEFSTPVLTATRSYFVSILTNEGCESERTEVIAEISVLPAPTVTAQGGFGFCEGGSVTLEGPSGFTSYLWSDNSTNKDLTVNTAGTYSLRVVDTNGCESQPTSVVVTQNANPVATITMSNDRLVTGQAASYQWFLFDEAIVGATESFLEINVLRYGIYSVQLISSAGCAVLSDPFVYLITGYEADQEKGVTLYPNPTSGTLSIQIENDVRMKSYTIYDNLGKTMLQRDAVSIDALEVTDWPSGIYTVQIEVENRTLTRRIIKL